MQSLEKAATTAKKRLEKVKPCRHFSKVARERTTETALQQVPLKPFSSSLVFVNGHLSEKLSSLEELESKGVSILPAEEASLIYGPLMDLQLHSFLPKEEDAFALFAIAKAPSPLFLHVEEGKSVQLTILHLQTKKSIWSPTFLQIYVDKGASLHVETELREENALQQDLSGGCFSQSVAVTVEEKAHLQWIEKTSLTKDYEVTSSFYGQVRSDASLKKIDLDFPLQHSSKKVFIRLEGKQAYAEVGSLLLAQASQKKDLSVTMEHVSEEAKSSQWIKTAAAGSSKVAFTGKIHIHKEAQKTDSYQLSEALLLSKKAAVVSMPNLEIFADDVSASHGSTISPLFSEPLFYLESRGLKKSAAKALLLEAFCRQLLEKYTLEDKETFSRVQKFAEDNAKDAY